MTDEFLATVKRNNTIYDILDRIEKRLDTIERLEAKK